MICSCLRARPFDLISSAPLYRWMACSNRRLAADHTQSMHASMPQPLCWIDGTDMRILCACGSRLQPTPAKKLSTHFFHAFRKILGYICDANNEWANECISYHLDSLSRFHTCRLYRRPSGHNASLLGWWPCVAGCRSGQSTKIIMKLLKHKRCW